MQMFFKTARILPLLLLTLIFLLTASQSVQAKGKKKFVPKKGVEQASFMFDHIEKRFIVTPDTNKAKLEAINRINNAVYKIDAKGRYPGLTFLETVASFGKQMEIVWPITFQNAHLQRLNPLPKNYALVFRLDKKTLTQKNLRHAAMTGPIRKIIEIKSSELDKQTLGLLKEATRFEIRIIVDSKKPLSSYVLKSLRRVSGVKELYIPETYPVKSVRYLKTAKLSKIYVMVYGKGPDKNIVAALNRLKGVALAAALRGVIKKEEARTYLPFARLSTFVLNTKGWKIEEDFIRLMNAKGTVD